MSGRTLPLLPELAFALGVVGLATATAAQDLLPSPPLAANVEALPRVSGDTAIARQLNATLQLLDDQDFQSVTCDEEDSEFASRTVKVLSDGPEFLSFLVSSGGACDGANYPFSETQMLNFDLETGSQTDLMQLLPDGWAEGPGANAPDDDRVLSLYLEMASEEIRAQCRDTLEGPVTFEFGIDGKGDRLVILPDGLLNNELGCETAVYVPVDRLAKAGFDRRLIDALSQEN